MKNEVEGGCYVKGFKYQVKCIVGTIDFIVTTHDFYQ